MRMCLCLGDVSLIKLGMSEEEYVHLSSEVRIFHFLSFVIYFSQCFPYIVTTDLNLFSVTEGYSKR